MMPEEPSALAFADNGEHLAVGFKNGQVSLLKTDLLTEVATVLDEKNAVTALRWTKLTQSITHEPSSLQAHFRSLLKVDPKPSEAVKELARLCEHI